MNATETKLRVLFVDDEPEILNGLRLTLRKERKRLDLLFAEGGEEALEILESQSIDVLCTDLQMPGIDGSELLSRMLASHSGVPRLVLSGQADDEVALRAISLSHGFLVKPAGREAIIQAITQTHACLSCIQDDELREMVADPRCLLPTHELHDELSALLQAKDCDIESVVDLAMQNPVLAARLLQFASSQYIASECNVISVGEATRSLGLAAIRSIASHLKPTADDSVPSLARHGHYRAFETRSLLTARIAEHIAREMQLCEVTARTAGLLSDIGGRLLQERAPERAARANANAIDEDRPLPDAQVLAFGIHNAQLGGALLSSWGLCNSIVDPIRYQHSPRRSDSNEFGLTGAIHIAHYLAHQCLNQLAADQMFPPQHLDLGFVHATGISAKIREWNDFTRDLAQQMLTESDFKAA